MASTDTDKANPHVLQPGDPVFHPKYGFGAVSSLIYRDPADLLADAQAPVEDAASAPAQNYYNIELVQGGTLSAPIDRAESTGLRRLVNSLAVVEACLFAPAEPLPANARERVARLRARELGSEPTALVAAVRDLVVYRRGQPLSRSEKMWLERACEHISNEVALVDHISHEEALAAVWNAVNRLSAPPPSASDVSVSPQADE